MSLTLLHGLAGLAALALLAIAAWLLWRMSRDIEPATPEDASEPNEFEDALSRWRAMRDAMED